MLHDPGSYTPPQDYDEIKLSEKEKDVLRSLGGELADISALGCHKDTAE